MPEIDHTAVDQYRSGVARLEPGGIILCRESTVRGETETRAGEYLGVAPAGRQIVWTSIQIDLIENGRIVESWVDWDKYRFFQGLGLV